MRSDLTRSKIRHKVGEILKGKTIAEGRVYSNRVRSLNDHEMPLIIIKTEAEKSREFNQTPKILERTLNLTIEAHLKAKDRIDDRLDFISSQIETVMKDDFTLGGLASDSTLHLTNIHVDDESEATYGSVDLVYLVKYHTEEEAFGGEV
jgi:hypothetical protein